MARCSFSAAGGLCGPSVDDPENVQCISLDECRRDIKGHLAFVKASNHDALLKTEAQLICARAGTKLQECPDYTSRVTIRSKQWGGRDSKIGTFGGMLLEFVKNFETCTLNRYFQVLKTHLI